MITLDQAKLIGVLALPADDSQCGKILNALHDADGEFVGVLDLMSASGSINVHSRVADLRRLGFDIENKTDHSVTPARSQYRLIMEAK